jgi:hypothetical protein
MERRLVTLNVAEKPSVAKGLTEVLARGGNLQKVEVRCEE